MVWYIPTCTARSRIVNGDTLVDWVITSGAMDLSEQNIKSNAEKGRVKYGATSDAITL